MSAEASGPRVDLIRAHFDAWNARDRAGMVAGIAEDVVVAEDEELQVAADSYRGHEGAFALWQQLFDVAPDARIDVTGIEELDQNRLLVLLTVHATLRASGIAGSHEMAHIWEFRGSEVARVDVFGSHAKARSVGSGRPE